MLRKVLLTLSMALLLSCEPVLKESTQPSPPISAAGGVTQVTTPPSPCTGCAVVPTTFTRSDPQVKPYVREFSGDPAASYLLIVQDDGQDGTAVEIKLNGEVVVPVTALRGLAVAEVKTAVTLSATNRLTVLPVGKVGAKVVVWVLTGAGEIGIGGGSIVAPGALATFTVPPGAFSRAAVVQIASVTPSSSVSEPLAPHSIQLTLPLSLGGVDTSAAVSMQLDLALGREIVVGALPYFHVVLPGGAEYWANATVSSQGIVSLQIPVAGLADFDKLGNAATFTFVVTPVEYVAGGLDYLRAGIAVAAGPSCLPLPTGAGAGAFAPCGRSILHRLQGAPASGQDAIVLVHGWLAGVGDWISYYASQGIICDASTWYSSCHVDPLSVARARLPGQKYFGNLSAALATDFPNAALYVFDYESFRDYLNTGADLATLLRQEQQQYAFRSVALVGHSMGGLVARVAALSLESSSGVSVPLSGVVALGSPHLGTPLPTDVLAKFLFAGVPTPGGQSLTRVLPRAERVPLRLYGGDISARIGTPNNPPTLYGPPYNTLCNTYGYCQNDGAVPMASALPANFGGAVLQPVFATYDHSQLINGQRRPLSVDPLYVTLVADLKLLMGGGPGTLVYSDDFSSGLGNWVEIDPDGLGSWTIQNGELFGDYNIGCGAVPCKQTQLLLADALQPVNNGYSNWRMEVQSGLVQAYCCFNNGAIVNLGKFVLYVSDTEKEPFDIGWVWNFGVQPPLSLTSALVSHQSYPWAQVGYVTQTVPSWNPHQWQTAILEKVGNQYTAYFKGNSDQSPNGVQMYSVSRTFSGPVKIGFSTYGGVRMDNFKLYRLP